MLGNGKLIMNVTFMTWRAVKIGTEIQCVSGCCWPHDNRQLEIKVHATCRVYESHRKV